MLPGAFCAYYTDDLRSVHDTYRALMQPKGIGQQLEAIVEDRCIVNELIRMRKTMRFVPSAQALTEVKTDLSSLYAQQRRWSVGGLYMELRATWSFFSSVRSCNSFFMAVFLGFITLAQVGGLMAQPALLFAATLTSHWETGRWMLAAWALCFATELFWSGRKPYAQQETIRVAFALLLSATFLTWFASSLIMFIRDVGGGPVGFGVVDLVFVITGVAVDFVGRTTAILASSDCVKLFPQLLAYVIMMPVNMLAKPTYILANAFDLSWSGTPTEAQTKEEREQQENVVKCAGPGCVVVRRRAVAHAVIARLPLLGSTRTSPFCS